MRHCSICPAPNDDLMNRLHNPAEPESIGVDDCLIAASFLDGYGLLGNSLIAIVDAVA